MTATNATIRQTIYDALADLSGVNRYMYPPESIQVPAVIVGGMEITRSTYDGGRQVDVSLLVLVSHSDTSQLEIMDVILDPTDQRSALAAIEAVTDANGVSVAWRTVGSYGELEWGGVTYYGAVVSCQVYT